MQKKIKKLQYDNYPQALDDLVRTLNAREFSLDEDYVVLCPDRYTLAVEQALFCREGGGAMDLEVLTLSRLARKVAPDAKTLPKEGGIMITARAIAAVKDKLGKAYKRAAEFDDFAREVYETIQQIASSDVDFAAIQADGATKIKLDDLALIKAEYDRIKGEYSDASDRLLALVEAAKDKNNKLNKHFLAIGYSDATKLINSVFNALAESGKSFTLYEAPSPQKRRDELDLFCAPDRISEYKRVAIEIRDHVFNGGRYEDISVICENPRALKRILGEYEIPTYTDESKPLYFAPPLAAIEQVYKLHTAIKNRNAIDCSALVALCKNPFSGCDTFCAEKLLDEVSTRALGYVPLGYEFSDDAGRAAARALGIVRDFSACSAFGEAVSRVLELYDFAGVQSAQADRATDVVTPIVGLVELLARYGSGDFDLDARAFFSAARAVNVNTLPRERDCVTVTEPSSLRMTAVKKLFITDFNEGVMPSAIADTGLISDAEIKATGEVIEPTCTERNRRSRDELKAVVLNAGSVFVTYTPADKSGGKKRVKPKRARAGKCGKLYFPHTGKPNYVKRNELLDETKAVVLDADGMFDSRYLKKIGKPATFIIKLANRINVYEFSENAAVLAETRDARFIAKHAPVPAAAREIVARKLTRHAPSVDAATEKCKAVYAPFADRINISHEPKLSSSEITNWFNCPYKRFLHDTVGLIERKSGFDASDFGTLLHYFMNKFFAAKPDYSAAAELPYDCSDAAVTALVDEVLKEKECELEKAEYKRFWTTAAEFARINTYILSKDKCNYRVKCNYDEKKTEYGFGGKTLGDRAKFEFTGQIDRFDLKEKSARIIDYKTGNKKLKIKECLEGRDMQLMLYAYALAGEYDVTGMFYVRTRPRYYTDKPEKPMSGVMIKDKDIAQDYDKKLVPGGEWSDIISMRLKKPDEKTGAIDFHNLPNSYTLLEKDKFDKLLDACKRNADVAADEIADGFIFRSPAGDACEYCPYIGICGGGTPREPNIDVKSIFGKDAPEIEEEEDD